MLVLVRVEALSSRLQELAGGQTLYGLPGNLGSGKTPSGFISHVTARERIAAGDLDIKQ